MIFYPTLSRFANRRTLIASQACSQLSLAKILGQAAQKHIFDLLVIFLASYLDRLQFELD